MRSLVRGGWRVLAAITAYLAPLLFETVRYCGGLLLDLFAWSRVLALRSIEWRSPERAVALR